MINRINLHDNDGEDSIFQIERYIFSLNSINGSFTLFKFRVSITMGIAPITRSLSTAAVVQAE